MKPRQLSYLDLEEPLLHRLPLREQPVQRIERLGECAVATTEVLAVLIGGRRQMETSVKLLETFGSLPALARASFHELQEAGLGKVAVARLKAGLELGRRLSQYQKDDKPQITTPADVWDLLWAEMGMTLPEQEQLWIILLNTRNRVIGLQMLYQGSLNQSQVRVGEVFREAVRRNCAAIVVAHTHPSGDPSPSPEDVAVTRDLVAAGKLLGIEVLDHLIIGQGRWVSLRERGLGFAT